MTDPALQDIAIAEAALWRNGFDPAALPDYQAAHLRLEEQIARRGADHRHAFVVFVPVADRPQQLADCLDSLHALCRDYGYGGQDAEGRWCKLRVIIAEDSVDPDSITAHAALAARMTAQGLVTEHFGPEAQTALLARHDDAQRAVLSHALGDAAHLRAYRGHKGQAATRNLAHLHLAAWAAANPHQRWLFWSIDSDQEFSVKVATPDGDADVRAIAYFHRLDDLFTRSDALLLTGKVVGDPPVSPAVMTANFLTDMLGFLDDVGSRDPHSPCRHHDAASAREGEASYHDMAERFGFRKVDTSLAYPCPLTGPHTEADAFAHFARRLHGFFYGEHPTRVSRYVHDDLWNTLQPARTVYAGNYVARAEALAHTLPFPSLRLRMSGPTLGRLLKAQLGPRFVSANLPMLHKRTLTGGSHSEFRPGVAAQEAHLDLNGEFERQFFGDVMLFSMEQLTADGFPSSTRPTMTEFCRTLNAVREDLLGQYTQRHTDILTKLAALRTQLATPAAWWQTPEHDAALAAFHRFADNVERNFGDDAPWRARIDSSEHWASLRATMADALARYPDDARAWAALVTPDA